uniref:Uncharacterized protein n=1 Tax=Anguilla anguilla TaxID=7936 RepID=A0A0E9UB26_ANGAN
MFRGLRLVILEASDLICRLRI